MGVRKEEWPHLLGGWNTCMSDSESQASPCWGRELRISKEQTKMNHVVLNRIGGISVHLSLLIHKITDINRYITRVKTCSRCNSLSALGTSNA